MCPHYMLLLQAEDITLTVGQAFDLAYQNFMAGSGKELELKKQVVTLQKKVGFAANSVE